MGLYRDMDRSALDAAYDNSAAVPGAERLLVDWRRRSDAIRRDLPGELDLAYGTGLRQRLDWFPSGPERPTVAFIHGGYWQWCDKEDFAFVAPGVLERGWNLALIEYTLAPAATMGGIVAEIGAALDWLAQSRAGRLVLAGHSAGGHLAALHRDHPAVERSIGISGIYDLEPIRLGRLNGPLRLSAAEANELSPIRRIGPGAPIDVVVGAAELPELRRQSADYARALAESGEPATHREIAGANHFSIIEDLAALLP
jgi:acetyl esterase/lipase